MPFFPQRTFQQVQAFYYNCIRRNERIKNSQMRKDEKSVKNDKTKDMVSQLEELMK